MAVRLTKAWGFNPGFGMQTTNVEGGTETIFHCNLAAPVQKAGVTAPNWAANDDLLLLKTKTCNRISRLEIFNGSGVAFNPTFFFAYFKDGKLAFPRYSHANVGGGAACYMSLGCLIDADNFTARPIKLLTNEYMDLWGKMGDNADDANPDTAGLRAWTWRVAPIAASANSAIMPQLEPNIGAIMDKTLRADAGARGALANDADGLASMSAIDTDVAICMHLGAALTQAQAALATVKIGIIETDISARNETEEYVKSWTQIPAQGVHAGDGVTLPYDPTVNS